MKSNFRRAQSKVWWGNSGQNDIFSMAEQRHILQSQIPIIQEDEISTASNLSSWDRRRGSPGSLKSHDSGFSDSENFQTKILNQSSPNSSRNTNKSVSDKLTPKKNVNQEINTYINSRSPSICSEQSTPPTVIRRKIVTDNHQCTARRISFSAPCSPVNERTHDSMDLNYKIDSINYSSTSPVKVTADTSDPLAKSPIRSSLKRGSRLSSSERKVTRNLLSCFSPFGDKSKMKEKSFSNYNNETVVFGCGDDNNNNVSDTNNASKHSVEANMLPTYSELYPTETSTPKKCNQIMLVNIQSPILSDSLDVMDLTATMNWNTCTYIEYTNPLLNGHAASTQFWLDEIRASYCHEVLSTLQTKSVAQEAARNMKVNSATAGKVIRHLQSIAMQLQNRFDKVERLLCPLTADHNSRSKVSPLIIGLFEEIMQYINKLKHRNVFRSENGSDLKRFEQLITEIIDMSIDLHKLVSSEPDAVETKTLRTDIQRLRFCVTRVTEKVFEKLIRIIVDRIEETQCDLILRSNLTMLSMLSNVEYVGIASLNDAFHRTNTVKVLLGICMGSKYSSVRTLALRALATICSTRELIRQLEESEGIDILSDVLTINGGAQAIEQLKPEPELREAVSVLTQITAPWHELMRSLDGLKSNLESLVESVSKLVEKTSCCQTLLLCAACLNNIVLMEATAVYSIISNESILKLKVACVQRGPGASIFLFVSKVQYFINATLLLWEQKNIGRISIRLGPLDRNLIFQEMQENMDQKSYILKRNCEISTF